jgi:hypothetical protein
MLQEVLPGWKWWVQEKELFRFPLRRFVGEPLVEKGLNKVDSIAAILIEIFHCTRRKKDFTKQVLLHCFKAADVLL